MLFMSTHPEYFTPSRCPTGQGPENRLFLQTGPLQVPPKGVLIPNTSWTLLPGSQDVKQAARANVCLCATKLQREPLTSLSLKTEYKRNIKEVPLPYICPLINKE